MAAASFGLFGQGFFFRSGSVKTQLGPAGGTDSGAGHFVRQSPAALGGESALACHAHGSGMRVSTANLFSYVGYFIVVATAISSLGIGLERMAWVISALSVGIGFGLQAVVQNFVSGLILLAERPIKIGDWVSLNGVEGNVRKINARCYRNRDV